MPVLNVTPVKSLLACDTSFVIDFSTLEIGCSLRIQDESTVNVTNYNYKFFIGASLVDEDNTAAVQYLWTHAPFFAGQTVLIRQTITATEGTFIKEKSVTLGAFSGCVINTWDSTRTNPSWQVIYANLGSFIVYDNSVFQDLTGTGSRQTINHTGLTGTTSIRTIGAAASLTGLRWEHATAQQTGALDISNLSALVYFYAFGSGTNNFSPIVWPSTLRNMQVFLFRNSALSSIDTSWIGNTSGDGTDSFFIGGHPNVTSLNLGTGTSSGAGSVAFAVSGMNGLTTLDASGRTLALTGTAFFNVLPVLTSFTPGSGSVATLNWQQNGSAHADLDTYTVTNTFTCFQNTLTQISEPAVTGKTIVVHSNTSLTTYTTNPGTTGVIRTFQFYLQPYGYFDVKPYTLDTVSINFLFRDLALVAAETNEMLVDLDGKLGAGTGTINIAGSSGSANAAPDAVSGGFDGLTAKNNLILNGYTVITN